MPEIHLVGVAALLTLSVIVLLAGRGRNLTLVVYGCALVISLVLCGGATMRLLMQSPPSSLALPIGLPWLGAHFRIDALSSFFLAIINFGGAAASLYGLGYGRHEREPLRVLPFFPAFLAGMNVVLMADDAFTFLLSWEFMSLASWSLVMAHHREADNIRAGLVNIVMAGIGAFALLLAFGVLAGPDGFYAFADMRTHAPAPLAAAAVLALVLFGAGSKAGLVPLHVWLPLAHPAAPSHVSALMSGVMTKVAVYAFIRVAFDLLGPPAWWWGVPVLILGAATAVIGVLFALVHTDLKRILAYSTIENIGIIFVALGLSLGFLASGFAAAAALAMTAALFHVLNHSLFKSLLFFGAGAVITATGSREIGQLGGLLNRMPATGLFMLVGCAAISALPPLNGFASEWLAFQAILLSPSLPSWALKLLTPAAGAMLALAAALAGACFVRLFGIAFLGRPRTITSAKAVEVDRFSLTAMGGLACLCLLAGIFPGQVIDALAPVARATTGAAMHPQAAMPWLSIAPIAESRSSYDGLLVFVFIVSSALLAAFIVHRLASNALRRAPAWDCGFPDADPITQYSAESFAQPVRRVFSSFAFRARAQVDMPPPGDLRPASYTVEWVDLSWAVFYRPVVAAVAKMAYWMNRMQYLTIRQYLSLVFAALVFLLLVLASWA
ncbi:hydrogenase 4 subunit B [Rhodoblastus sphagnicola]|uniref:Hydrogenase 4 subunit B n=1 Tax=Rhodoblastus sphagnicola TaxID=333368 RepID=A0A2S6MWK2_9HYPH|nr:hydrogenase 4 subunit B [Rhodoblastus sphagnicola]MBB4200036.1 formate hydrogenlyase subunit 3/multisubunit Na+/H+ antiporter MnhD subunit [Rhodoblastus sphagnicola]PPQ26740.1 hydrogenase 4 subunit B [Rhodoblastus sphagnicola]